MAPEDARAPQASSPSPNNSGEAPPNPAEAPPDSGKGPPGLGEGLPDFGEGLPGLGEGLPGGLYHERQRLELCALHALNNLLQQPWLSKAQADAICRRLAPGSRPNPHRSPLGTGNYDVNVVMAALGTRGLAAVWWDKRRPLERLSLPHVLGFLLNVPSQVRLGALALPLRRPHWLGVRRLGGTFYNLDSKLPAPAAIGSDTELRCAQVCLHWLGVRRLGGTFYNLDSKLPTPAAIGAETELRCAQVCLHWLGVWHLGDTFYNLDSKLPAPAAIGAENELRCAQVCPHWQGVRRLGGTFYNLDSKLPAPAAIGAETKLRQFLREALAKGPSELFLVVPQDVEETGAWLRPE